MNRDFELELTELLLDVVENPTVEMAEDVYEVPVEHYVSPDRFALERDQLFGRTPLLAALASELPEPGSWKIFDEAGVPIVLVRGEDGVVRGFLNVCGHRGARLVEEPRGQGRRLSCPFHGWSYNIDGTLGGVPAHKAFPALCRDDRGLRPVPTREHLGAIWVVPRDDSELDVDAHLGPFALELARWEMDTWHYVETRVHDVAANWKITMDTFTEGYHIPVLHKDSLGTLGATGTNLYDRMGDHHRQVFPMSNLYELRNLPKEQWNGFEEWRFAFTYVVYPNTTFLIAGDHAEMYQTFPGATVDRSVCLHSLFAFEPVETDDDRKHYSGLFDFFFDLVETEDFRVSAGIERGLRTGAFDTFLLGRYEPMTQAMHRAFERDLTRPGRTPVVAAGS